MGEVRGLCLPVKPQRGSRLTQEQGSDGGQGWRGSKRPRSSHGQRQLLAWSEQEKQATPRRQPPAHAETQPAVHCESRRERPQAACVTRRPPPGNAGTDEGPCLSQDSPPPPLSRSHSGRSPRGQRAVPSRPPVPRRASTQLPHCAPGLSPHVPSSTWPPGQHPLCPRNRTLPEGGETRGTQRLQNKNADCSTAN